MFRVLLTLVLVAWVRAESPAVAAGGYSPAEERCRLADPAIAESSGVAAASWDEDVIWTHNDSGDAPRFFAVDTTTCETLAVYDVTGAEAVDWEDMTVWRETLYFGDIGDNPESRDSITVYEVPEPDQGAASGPVRPSSARVFIYPDGAHNAESLLVDPTTDRLVVVTKTEQGPSSAYRAPAEGDGVMEKVADVTIPGLTTGGDASAERLVIRTYVGAFEWDVRPADTLAQVLGRAPVPVALPLTQQGEAIAYSRDGSGLWTTSESQGAPVHFLGRAPELEPVPTAPESTAPPEPTPEPGPDDDSDPPVLGLLVLAAVLGIVGVFVWRRRRTAPDGRSEIP